jgi:4-amino-4-deoxy-L-arabinose transferase-like glycosyltransferase
VGGGIGRGAALPIALALVVWAACAVSFSLRPVLPVDETRYLSVAWEMWLNRHVLVPHLNGAPYSHKPPLLFWLIDLAWLVTGPSATAARAIALISSVASAVLTGMIARVLWPDRHAIGAWAAMMIAAGGLFTVFSTLIMFDLLLAAAVLLAMLGMLLAWRRGAFRWWALAAAGIGLGILAKGPVALLHVVAIGALAPLWMAEPPPGGWRRWYGGIGVAVLGGAAVGLAWAIPAALVGGPEYEQMILWGQTAGRVANAFAHRRPWYFYLVLLPLFAWPWGWWPAFWRGLYAKGWRALEPELRLCVVWFVALLIAFSVISSKQIHYLVPDLPALALIAARIAVGPGVAVRRRDLLPPLALLLLIAALPLALDALAALGRIGHLPPPLVELQSRSQHWPALALIGLLAVLCLATPRRAAAQAAAIAGGWAATVVAVHLLAGPAILPAYDFGRVAAAIHARDACGVAWVGDYEGEINFVARLTRPVTLIEPGALDGWLAAHPGGVAIDRYSDRWRNLPHRPGRVLPYRGKELGLWLAPGDPAGCAVKQPG